MQIEYTFETKQLTKETLVNLFTAVEWDSANYPDKLYKAILNSHAVVTAWDGEKLVGLANALSDGALTAYFHYVLTDPNYQGKGIGKEMMEMLLENYKDYYTKVLISYPLAVNFYNRLGFKADDESTPLYLYN